MTALLSPDYAKFRLENGKVIPGKRLEDKLKAIPIPEDLTGKTVLDVGCDYGQFSFLAASRGAANVLGLDRNRLVRDVGFVDLIEKCNYNAERHGFSNCFFDRLDLGREWIEGGKRDIIFLFSLYHHIYENCGDHLSIFYWLWRHCSEYVLWENPVDLQDAVAARHVSRDDYNEDSILDAASEYFDIQYLGPAVHEPYRKVYKLTAKKIPPVEYRAQLLDGAGGATKAFQFNDGQRMREIEKILGFSPYPGSLNAALHQNFMWDKNYYRAAMMDVKDRKKGLSSEWHLRWARFYPVTIDGIEAFAFRFEGEKYQANFIELIAPIKLRDELKEFVCTILS